MHQLNIQFDHQLVDVAFTLANQSEDGNGETLVTNAQTNCRDGAPDYSAPQINPTSDESNTFMQLEQTVDLLASQLAKIQSDREKLRKEMVGRIDLIAGRIAEFVFREDSELAETRLRSCLAIALETLDQQSEILVKVHPSQLHSIIETLAHLPSSDYLKITSDDQVGVGDCRVEQDGQGLYASLDDQLERVAIQINESYGKVGQAS